MPPPASAVAARVALLTAGRDKPYALGLGPALADHGIKLDFIGSDDVDGPELASRPSIRFFNLRGNQSSKASLPTKILRVLLYYTRLLKYSATSSAKLFHILWNNKFELFDRTLLMLYYRCLGKKLTLTVHNVNANERDGNDSLINRATLRIQYKLCDHLFVHTPRMKAELMQGFGVAEAKISTIPFGINNTLPVSPITKHEARSLLQLSEKHKVLLFFGNIAPYKGLDLLVASFVEASKEDPNLHLIVAGRPKGSEAYWATIQKSIRDAGLANRVHEHIEFIPDEKVEVFFKAADVLVLPYNHVFQSGVLFLGYSFGLPVIATDVGSLRDEIIEGTTGLVCPPKSVDGLLDVIHKFFRSPMFTQQSTFSNTIKKHANEHYSWATVAASTNAVYTRLLQDRTN